MDSTNNEIYKIAKYLDKYTKGGNKEEGNYLQKLDNYLHKVQYGGNGNIVQLAQQIGEIVDEVVKRHQAVKGELEQLVEGVSVPVPVGEEDNLGKRTDIKGRELLDKKKELKKKIEEIEKKKKEASSASESAPVLHEKVHPSAEELAQKEQAKQLAQEAVQVQQALTPVSSRDISNPTSKKFDIVGYTINKQSQQSTYVIPEKQKATVLKVLPQELKVKLESQDVKLSEDRTKARIEFNDFLSIKEILQQINERLDLQPTQFKTTDKEGNIIGNPLNVWLFIVPAHVKIGERITQQEKDYFDAIKKIREEELEKILSIMNSIIKQPIPQPPGGRGAGQ